MTTDAVGQGFHGKAQVGDLGGEAPEGVRVVAAVEAHWEGIIAWQQSRLSNGLLEGTNSLVQAATRRARGYRSKAKMITIIYLIAGKLPLPEIHTI